MATIESYFSGSSSESDNKVKSPLLETDDIPNIQVEEEDLPETQNQTNEVEPEKELPMQTNAIPNTQNIIDTNSYRKQILSNFKQQENRIKEFETLKEEIPDFEQLEKAFYDISPNTLFFDVKFKDKIINVIREKFNNLKDVLPEISTDEFWNETEIDNMFGKGFNPTSLVTSAESAEWFGSHLEIEEDSPIYISESGPGAGWSTTMLFNEIQSNYPNKKLYLYAIDKSPHSIATTQALLEYYGIKHILIKDASDMNMINSLTEHGELDSCVILNLGHTNTVLEKYPDDFFHGFYSTHGNAYFSESEYKQYLDIVHNKGKDKSVLVTDSLNPHYVNHLSKLYLLPQMLFPNAMKKYLDKKGITYLYDKKKLPNASKYYDETIVIKAFNEKRADQILLWSNYLIRNLKLSRLLKTIQSLSVTMDVVERYRCDVYPSTKLREIAKTEQFEEIVEDRPDFTIFLETIGFKTKK